MKITNCIRISLFLFAFAAIHRIAIAEVTPQGGVVQCYPDPGKLLTNCDYSYAASIKVKEVSLKVGNEPVQIPEKGIFPYPLDGQTTAVLFLVDISDPNRKNTVEVKNKQHLMEMLIEQKEINQKSKTPFLKAGIATFDSEMVVLSPIGSDDKTNTEAVNKIRATGQATEFYKNILAAIQILKSTDATRKGLVLMSDGKDEDRAYKSEDVIQAAKDANVVILGMGYTEKASDTPYLQTIERLTKASNGEFIDATNAKLPSAFLNDPFGFLDKGGRISFNSSEFYGSNVVHVVLGLENGESIDLSTNFNFPDDRSLWQKIVAFTKHYWYFMLLALAIGATLIAISRKLVLHRNAARQTPTTYGYLEEFDGLGTRHPISKTTICIGRSADTDVCLVNDSISSHHAEIHRRRDGGFYIVDLASTNGVYVNEKKVDRTELNDGDFLELGEVRFRFSISNL
jgi:hypothetical protein